MNDMSRIAVNMTPLPGAMNDVLSGSIKTCEKVKCYSSPVGGGNAAADFAGLPKHNWLHVLSVAGHSL